MKIKRFVDKDMRTVLRRVREEQGPDAVILSNQRVADGIEVIAAVDYDAALMQHALGQPPAAGAADRIATEAPADDPHPMAETCTPAASEKTVDEPRSEAAHVAPPEVLSPAAEDFEPVINLSSTPLDILLPDDDEVVPVDEINALVSNDASLSDMRAEISSLRGLLETQVSGLLWKEGTRRTPMLSQVLRNLAKLGIAPDVAQTIVARLGPVDTVRNVWQQPLAALAQLIPVATDQLLEDGGVAALIGPTGVGKTTTIAKLAARYAMRHGADSIALVCADAYRIGAREHLTAFASILGVQVYAASDPEDLGRILAQLRSKKLVLIDTEGLSQRDADLTNRLASWQQNGEQVSFYLTLSACGQEAALDETIRRFSQLPLAGAIVTKVDEAGQLGCVLSALIRQQLPLAWVTDGQHIPDDLHNAEKRKLWILKRAVDCMEASQPRVCERTMAENYGTVSTQHA